MNFLSVVIPAYNEGPRIEETIRRVASFLSRRPYAWEVLVVDDGSRDDTAAQVEALQRAMAPVRLVRHDHNQGKGAAVRTGLQKALGEAILFCDADGATPIEELDKLLPHLAQGADFVVGSRRIPGSMILVHQGWTRRWMSDVYQFLCRRVLALAISDFTCGFKLLSRPAAQLMASRMRINRWSFDAEMFLIAKIHHLKTIEVPIRWKYQRTSQVRLRRDVLDSFREILRIRRLAASGAYQEEVLSLVEKGWAGARCLSIELAREGMSVFHLVKGRLPREIVEMITPHRGITVQGFPVGGYRIAAWALLMRGQLQGGLGMILTDNPRMADWIVHDFPRLKEKVVLVGETATGAPHILRKGSQQLLPSTAAPLFV